jgi:bifunctional non-homologous end joining protein LigD
LLDTLRAPRVKFSDHVRGDGQAVVDDACKMSLEGIVSKRTDARYVGGRTKTWLKSKCGYRQEFVILGYTDPRGSRQEFGAILLGYHDPQGKLVYAGRVGTGFDSDLLKQIKSKMASHARQTPPTDTAPPARERRNAHWIEPRLVAEIKFAGWTSDNMIRQGAFLGLRKDKPAAEIVREDQPAELTLKRFKEPAAPPAKLSHPDRIVFPGTKITKADVGKYYELVAARMMPHIVQRPLTLMRYPSGIGGPSFVQRHAAGTPPPGIEPIKGERDAQTYLTIRDPDGLQALVQMNAIEIHAWGCAPGEIEKPDRLVFDLDPHESLPWKQIVKAAMDMKEILESVKLRPLVKTTGGKGLHIVVPIKPTIDWEHAKSFSRQIAQELQRRDRSAYTTNLRKTERPGRVFIDYLRNGRSATSAAPYCLRARKGAPISMPVDWERLPSLKAANRFTLENVAKELKKSDPWSGFESNRVDLHKIVGAK